MASGKNANQYLVRIFYVFLMACLLSTPVVLFSPTIMYLV